MIRVTLLEGGKTTRTTVENTLKIIIDYFSLKKMFFLKLENEDFLKIQFIAQVYIQMKNDTEFLKKKIYCQTN